uniref:Uncharacterized protein n=1 Tax=Arion vulgaris TaxID=1028688 RepID=A0A0B7A2G1_9EUPU
MKAFQISFILGILLTLFVDASNGLPFYRPYDVYNARAARWPSSREVVSTAAGSGKNGSGLLNEPDYYTIISYLNDVGRRRR